MRWINNDVGSNPAPMTLPRIENAAGPRTHKPRTTHGNGGEASGDSNHKVSLIVGGVGGLAEPLALAFAERGMNVAIIFLRRRATLAESIKRRVEQAGRRCLLITNRESDRVTPHVFARRTIDNILREFGRLDVFISLSPKSSIKDRPNGDSRSASNLVSSIIPNIAVMKAALNEIAG